MNSREFLKANKAILLTLPGAALWSLPVGLWAWTWIQRRIPFIGSIDPLSPFAGGAFMILAPLAAICSFWAMELFAGSRSNHGIAVLFLIFNLITAVCASLVTIIEAMMLFG